MKKIILISILSIFVMSNAYAHSGRTDSNGGHKCSAKSQSKGLCKGYHYHNKGNKQNNKEDNED